MLISDKHRFVFIHNPKCAGTSIYKTLLPYANYLCRFAKPEGQFKTQVNYYIIRLFGEGKVFPSYRYHVNAERMNELLGAKKWQEYFSFGVARNPYSRLLSNYHYIRQRPDHTMKQFYTENATFKDFVMNLDKLPWHDFQHYYLTINKEIAVKKVLRFEKLAEDFIELLNTIGLPDLVLRKENILAGESNFMQHYDDDMIGMVNEIYADDFRIFGYEKLTRVKV